MLPASSLLSSVDFRKVNVDDDAAFSQFYRSMRDAELFERADPPYWSEHEAAVMFRRPEPGETMDAYAAYDDSDATAMRGVAILGLTYNDNIDKAFFDVAVPPENRHLGVGSGLLRFLEGLATDAGRTTFLTESHLPFDSRNAHPYRQFAEKRGYALANVEVTRRLKLPVADELIQQWIDESAPHHQDYRIETFVNDIPDELVESFCYLHNQLALDSPTGDIDFEAESLTPEGLKIRQEKLLEAGRTVYETLAIDKSGEAVAQSTLATTSSDTISVFQWGTLVRRDHRGHRLGMATKAANLRAMQKDNPERTQIVTSNAEDNDNMVRINEKMGFEPIELMVEWQRKLDPT